MTTGLWIVALWLGAGVALVAGLRRYVLDADDLDDLDGAPMTFTVLFAPVLIGMILWVLVPGGIALLAATLRFYLARAVRRVAVWRQRRRIEAFFRRLPAAMRGFSDEEYRYLKRMAPDLAVCAGCGLAIRAPRAQESNVVSCGRLCGLIAEARILRGVEALQSGASVPDALERTKGPKRS